MSGASAAAARTTLLVLGAGLVASMLLVLAFTTLVSVPGPASGALLVGLAAFGGACAGRMRWISHFAFRTKNFDAALIPHHYVWVATGTAIVLVFLALPGQLGVLPTEGLGLYALAFALGIFSEDVWDVVHGRIRALLGKKERDDPVLPPIHGVDVPLEVLEDVVLADGARASEVVRKLQAQGLQYGHELLAWRDAKKLARLADRAGIPPATLEQLAGIVDALRDKRSVAPSVASAAKAQGLGIVVKSE